MKILFHNRQSMTLTCFVVVYFDFRLIVERGMFRFLAGCFIFCVSKNGLFRTNL